MLTQVSQVITAARCLQGTAESGQLQRIFRSFQCSGKTFSPNKFAICKTSVSNSLFKSFDIIMGFAIIASINFAISEDVNSGIVSSTV